MICGPTVNCVTLRDEHQGENHRYLCAYVDEHGLHIDGQDIGPCTEAVTDEYEYEWCQTIAVVDIPRFVSLLGGREGEDVLVILTRHWCAAGRSYELERLLRESDISIDRTVW
jgi:hypothetical protein